MTYYPSLAAILGLKESIIVCQLLYWTPKTQDADGWVYKSSDEFERETGLSYKEQIRVRKALRDRNLLQEKNVRSEHRVYFRINADVLDRLGEHMTNGHMPKGQEASAQKSDGICPKVSPYKEAEITTESTQKNISSTLFDLSLETSSEKKTDVISAAFDYFREQAGKSQFYVLTEKRRKMGEQRWKEAVAMVSGQVPAEKVDRSARALFGKAIKALLEDEFMVAGGYIEWEQIFRSPDRFTKWIDRYDNPPTKKKGSTA